MEVCAETANIVSIQCVISENKPCIISYYCYMYMLNNIILIKFFLSIYFSAGDTMNIRCVRPLLLCSVLIFYSCYNIGATALAPDFGEDGRVAVALGTYGDLANAVVIQPDEKILVAGSTSNTANQDFMLFRLLTDGSMDPEFNIDGTVSTQVGAFDDEILALALQQDGKIIAAGYSSNAGNHDFAMVRYNSNGSLDRNFGFEGMVVTAVGESDDDITDVAIQDDGKIVLIGTALGKNGRVVVLARYLPNGTPDPSFADNGFSLSVVGLDAQAESVVLADDGRIIISGVYTDADKAGLMLIGFNETGKLERDFGYHGVATPADSSVYSEGYGIFLREDGRLLVAGSVGKPGERDATLFQFGADGLPDSEFADNGAMVTVIERSDDVLYDVIVTKEIIAATGVKIAEDGRREALLLTYAEETQTDALEEEAVKNTHQLTTEIVTAEGDNEEGSAVALAAVDPGSVVVVGASGIEEISNAEVSKYTLFNANLYGASNRLGPNNQFILTGEPYDVTRTTAIIPVEILTGLGLVSERGIVFDTVPNPVLKDSSSSTDNANSDSGATTNDDIGSNDDIDTTAPAITNQTSSSFSKDALVTLSVSTDEAAICKYNQDSDADYSAMGGAFSNIASTSHSVELAPFSEAGIYSYYVRCVDGDGNTNSAGTKVSFTITDNVSQADLFFFQEGEQTAATATFASSNRIIQTGLHATLETFGSLFVSTAIAQENNTADSSTTATTDSTTEDDFLEEGSVSGGSGTGLFSAKVEGLKPGTFFYARAYAVIGGITYYGNQVGFRTSDSCFVATAAFGSVFHPSVKILRDFRDQFMSANPLSSALVNLYYRCSPPVADIISRNNILRVITRALLLPIVGSAWLTMQLGWIWLLLPAMVFSWILLTIYRKQRTDCI
ncbi:MAG: hypothetical protein D3924_00925 [Candidatus Electrothrix sp. AR4]|nr:hypothetical protein [Candidatus Electrothrix sp. AR4]